MSKSGIETYNKNSEWKRKRQGSSRPCRGTKAEQQAKGRSAATRDKTENTTKKLDGTIGEKNSYGSDPNPPKDKN